MLKDIATSVGIATVEIYELETPSFEIVKTEATPAEEVVKFDTASERMESDIEDVRERAVKRLAPEELTIFDACLMMAEDPELVSQITSMVENDKVNAELMTSEVVNMMVTMFGSTDNEHFKKRVADVKDVTFRLRCNLLGLTILDLSVINEDSVIITCDLVPSDTAQLNEYAKGFATNIGGKTSHFTIVVNSLEIPTVVGCGGVLDAAGNDDTITLDALDGVVILNPTVEEVKEYEGKRAAYMEEKKALKVLEDAKPITTGGHEIKLVGNIGTPDDIGGVLNNGGEGTGLYRTEFLRMYPDYFPTEGEQFKVCEAVLEDMGGRYVVVRTLGIDGDKRLPYFAFDPKMNPFLGYRAIRLCLGRTEIFRTQLHVLIRTSVCGRLCIMLPVIAVVGGFRRDKAILEEEREKLTAEGVKVADKIEVGMMVEIPVTAVNADSFAKEADFSPIGTNDLIQYSIAVDRMNEKASYLYQPCDPSILRPIKMTTDGIHKGGKWAGICGAMAGKGYAVPVFPGPEFDGFSMSATQILKACKVVTSLSEKEMGGLAEGALKQVTTKDILALVKKAIE